MKPVRVVTAMGVLFAACIALSSVHPWGNPRVRHTAGRASHGGQRDAG